MFFFVVAPCFCYGCWLFLSSLGPCLLAVAPCAVCMVLLWSRHGVAVVLFGLAVVRRGFATVVNGFAMVFLMACNGFLLVFYLMVSCRFPMLLES